MSVASDASNVAVEPRIAEPRERPVAKVPPEWFNLIRRLQSVARSEGSGFAVLHVDILVDGTGRPIIWTEPSRKMLEPKAAKAELLRLLSDK